MKYDIIVKHFGDRVEYHVVFIENRVIKESKTFIDKKDAEKYIKELEKEQLEKDKWEDPDFGPLY